MRQMYGRNLFGRQFGGIPKVTYDTKLGQYRQLVPASRQRGGAMLNCTGFRDKFQPLTHATNHSTGDIDPIHHIQCSPSRLLVDR